jgi:Zn finger protein HypA/HybF involved in hydrogenase expression
MVLITSATGDFERYEPEEKDWGHPEFGPSPSDWESSPKIKFKQHKPVHVGYYSCNYGYGSTYSSLYWDGENFGDWEYGKFHPKDQKGIVTWQGYNWDTSNWVNQPPEPPNVVCTNKKCNWVGDSSERVEDEEYNDHCPHCNGTDFDWIDYDPDTAKGRKNREKYCKEWDPAVALSRLPVPDNLGPEPDCECVQCDWKGTVDETLDDDGEMVCPKCKEPVEIL